MPIGGRSVAERTAWCDREVQKVRLRLARGLPLRRAAWLECRLARLAVYQRAVLRERDDLIAQWLPLVRHVAMKFKLRNPALSLDDLLGAGSVGLTLAAEQYRAGGPASFKTYAHKSIWSHLVKECFQQRSLIVIRHNRVDCDAARTALAAPVSLDAESGPLVLAPERSRIYEPDDFQELDRRLDRLPPRMAEAVRRRYLDPDQGDQTLPEVARQMGVGTSHVYALIEAALERLRCSWPGVEEEEADVPMLAMVG